MFSLWCLMSWSLNCLEDLLVILSKRKNGAFLYFIGEEVRWHLGKYHPLFHYIYSAAIHVFAFVYGMCWKKRCYWQTPISMHAQKRYRNLFNNSGNGDLRSICVCYLLWLMWCDFWLQRKLMVKIISRWPSQSKHTHAHIHFEVIFGHWDHSALSIFKGETRFAMIINILFTFSSVAAWLL